MPQPLERLSVARKIWSLLNGEERNELVVLGALLIVAMVLEAVSAGFVVPAVAILAGAGQSEGVAIIGQLGAALGDPSPRGLMLYGIFGLAALYVAKNAFLVAMVWRQSRFTHALEVQLSRRLLSLYLAQPYPFHLQRNSAHLASAITVDVNLIAVWGVTAALTVCAETLVLIALGALLLAVEPEGAVVAGGIVAGAVWIYHRATHRRVDAWGATRQFHEDRAHQQLQQSLAAVKEIIMLGRADDFVARYSTHQEQRGIAAHRHDALSQTPRFALEALAMIGVAALTAVLLADDRQPAAAVATLALFAAVAFRALPSLNRVLNGLQTVRYMLPSLDRLHDEFASLAHSSRPNHEMSVPVKGEIELRDVSFAYPGTEGRGLSGASMRISRGERVGIVGPSGSGKTTLIDILLGLLVPDEGSVSVDGLDIRTNPRAWQSQVGYVPQALAFSDDSVRRNVAFGIPDEQIDDGAVSRAIRAAQLGEWVAKLPRGLDTIIGDRGIRVSGGERQRIGIARALYHDPEVLVLDEATNALDPATERGLMETVRTLQRNKTVVIVSHRASSVAGCDRIYRVAGGGVLEETTHKDVVLA